MTEALSPIIGQDMAELFFDRIYRKMEEQGQDIEKTLKTLTRRAEDGLIADMLIWAIDGDGLYGEDWTYWVLMDRIIRQHFTGKVLSKG